MISAYLTFFPVTIAGDPRARSPDPRALELMRSYAAGWWRSLEGAPAGRGAVPLHRAQDRARPPASSAPSSARGRPASRRARPRHHPVQPAVHHGPEKLWATVFVCGGPRDRLLRARAAGRAALLRHRGREARGDDRAGSRGRRRPRVGKTFAVAGRPRPWRWRTSTSPSAPASSSASSVPPAAARARCCGIVGDLTAPSAGAVEVNGKPATQARLDRDYGMVFQAPVLFDWRTIEANVRLPLEVMGLPGAARRRVARCSSWSS